MLPFLRVLAPGLAAVLLGACFDFDATTAGGPLDDGGGTTPPTLDDAGTDATVIPNGGDSSANPDSQSPPPNDSGGDTGTLPPLSDSGSSYCSTVQRPVTGIFFCDDFDESSLPGSWSSYKETEGTILDTDAGAVSPPTSVDLTTSSSLQNFDAVDISLRKAPLSVPSLPSKMRFEFQIDPLRIDTTANAAIVLGAVDFLDGATDRYSVELAINVQNGAAALALGEQSGLVDGAAPYVSHPLPPSQPLAMNTWSDVTIAIDWTASSLTGSVVINGATVLDSAPLTMTVQPTSIQVGIGSSYVTEYASQASPVWELRYDNVVFSAQ